MGLDVDGVCDARGYYLLCSYGTRRKRRNMQHAPNEAESLSFVNEKPISI